MSLQQTGEYATDEEDAGTAVDGGDKSIEVFDLPESEDILSPSELDATKLYQKFREVKSREFPKKPSETKGPTGEKEKKKTRIVFAANKARRGRIDGDARTPEPFRERHRSSLTH